MSIPFKVDFLGKKTPAWLCDLNNSLWNILDGKNFVTEYIPEGNKWILQTVKLSDRLEQEVTTLLKNAVPQNITVEYDPFPLDYTRLAYLEKLGWTGYIDPLLNAYTTSWEISFQPVQLGFNQWVLNGFYETREAQVQVGVRGASDYPPYSAFARAAIFGAGELNCSTNTALRKVHSWLDLVKGEAYLSDGIEERREALTKYPEGDAPFLLFARYSDYQGAPHRLFFFNAWDKTNVSLRRMIPVIDRNGEACMYDTVTKQAFYKIGWGAFAAGIETLAQLHSMLAKLPDKTGQEQGALTIRLDAALQTDELRALIDARAEAKNWEITEAA